jgi:hypothetical protein
LRQQIDVPHAVQVEMPRKPGRRQFFWRAGGGVVDAFLRKFDHFKGSKQECDHSKTEGRNNQAKLT